MIRNIFVLAVVTLSISMGTPSVGQAAFTFQISDNWGNDTGILTSADDNDYMQAVVFNYGSGVTLRVSVNSFSNTPGSDGLAYISTQTIDVKRGGAGALPAIVLTIKTDSTGFSLDPSYGQLTTTFTTTNLLGSVTGFSSISGTHVVGSDVALGNTTTGTGVDDTNVSVIYPNPFSLGNTMVLSLDSSMAASNTALANVTIESTVLAAPAPIGLVMVATALPFFGLFRRRFSKSVPTIAA